MNDPYRDAITREELLRGINMLMRSGGGSIRKPFPYTEEEMMRDRGTLWQAIKRLLRKP